MAESMRVSALTSSPRHGRRVKLPHPHLAPRPKEEPPPPPAAVDWTPDLLPEWMRRQEPAGAWRSPAAARAEKTLRSALWLGSCLNGAALLLPRIAPSGRFEEWEYGGADFLLAAAVLVSGRALLALGAHCRREP